MDRLLVGVLLTQPRAGLEDFAPHFVRYVLERRRNELDTHMCNAGREGWGKSSLGIQLALALKPDLSPEEIILDEADYYRVYDPEKEKAVYVFDEAARIFFNRDWAAAGQRDRVKDLMENRQTLSVFFWHLPQFKSLDKYGREGRIDLRTSATRQGVAMLRELHYDAYNEEAYYPVRIDQLFWKPLKDTHPEFARRYYQRKKNAHIQAFKSGKRNLERSSQHEEYLQKRRERRWARATE